MKESDIPEVRLISSAKQNNNKFYRRVAEMVEREQTADAAAVLDRLAASAVRQHSAENFPVALRLVPAPQRDQLLRVYTYARFVDDVGDTAPGDRLALLDLIAADVRRLPHGTPQLAPVSGL